MSSYMDKQAQTMASMDLAGATMQSVLVNCEISAISHMQLGPLFL